MDLMNTPNPSKENNEPKSWKEEYEKFKRGESSFYTQVMYDEHRILGNGDEDEDKEVLFVLDGFIARFYSILGVLFLLYLYLGLRGG